MPKTIHGHAGRRTPTYMAWISMVRRCKDRRTRHAKYYIGKGITVCEQWKDYERFLADMGEKPVGYRISLDRQRNGIKRISRASQPKMH
jgi:hypothetical protein